MLIVALTSKTLTRGQMYDAAANVLQQRLSQISGIGQVHHRRLGPAGGAGRAQPDTRCSNTASGWRMFAPPWPRPTRIARRARSRPTASTTSSTPTIRRRKAADYVPLVIAYRNGAPVRLSDVAEVDDSVENLRNAGLSQRQARGADHPVPSAWRQYHRAPSMA